MVDPLDLRTRQIAFEQFARNFLRALAMTPAGWAVVVAMAWGLAPVSSIVVAIVAAALCWGLSVAACLQARREGFDARRHRRRLWTAAFVDGVGWGLVPFFLMGLDATLDARLAAVLCGVVAVTVGVYLTSLPAMRLQIGGTWVGLAMGVVLDRSPDGSLLFGLAVMHLLTLVFLPGIAVRVMDGIRLQQANADLAETLRLHLVAVEEEAATDPLTGVLNRRALERALARETDRSDRAGDAVAVLVLDLDHFKAVNDAHGHGVGDEALRAFARRIRENLRQSDQLARIGGEEFVVLLPGTMLATAVEVAERLRVAVAALPLVDLPCVAVTVSIGVAARRSGETAATLMARADAAAYAAKRTGRDRVVVASD